MTYKNDDKSKAADTAPATENLEATELTESGQGRREFFKKAAKTTVTVGILGAAMTYVRGLSPISSAHASVAKADMPSIAGGIPKPNAEVPPGSYDEYYGFWSGGQSGEVRILGIPSMRELLRIPVFNFSPYGWGITNYSKNLLRDKKTGKIPLTGDTHHFHLSYTDGTYDGKYAWINDKAQGRLARIRLDTFVVDAITKLPNCQGTHGIFPSRDKLNAVYCNSEFRNPLPNDGRLMDKPKEYGCLHTCVDAETMKVRWQCWADGNMDLCATDYHGKYSMATCYNSEDGVTVDQMMAKDRDFLMVFNLERIEAAVKAGKYMTIEGSKDIPVIDGRGKNNPYVLYIPIPKNPHGVNIDPTGKYAICSGKLSPTVSIIPLTKIDDAFAGKIKNPRDCVVAEPEVGLGPLHTAFDGRGNAYTSIFIDSVSTKWNIEKAVAGKNPVIEKLDVMYQPGHTNSTMSETKEAVGDWLISLNKFSKDRFLPVGPRFPDNDQLIDISQRTSKKMRLVHDGAIAPEPHDCVIVKRSIIKPQEVWDYNDRKFDYERNLLKELSTKDGGPALELKKTNKIFRDGKKVHVFMTSQAPKFGLTQIDVKQGDEVFISLTNIDDVADVTHGFCISEYDINFGCDPHETNSVNFVADKKGVYWYYCSWFCHALHLEMRGRLLVS